MQRICIARELVKELKILIFDEVTISLDKINENKITEIIESLRDKVSIIFIIYKPNILKNRRPNNICKKMKVFMK